MEVSQWLGVSQHSLYAWKKKFAGPTPQASAEFEGLPRRLPAKTDQTDSPPS